MDRKAASSKPQKETKPSRTLFCCSLAKTGETAASPRFSWIPAFSTVCLCKKLMIH